MATLIIGIGIGGGLDGLHTSDVYQCSNTTPQAAPRYGRAYVPASQVCAALPAGQVDAPVIAWTASRMSPGRVEGSVPLEAAGSVLAMDAPLAGQSGVLLPLSAQTVEVIVCAPEYGWPWSCVWALAVVQCESTYNPMAWATQMIRGVRYYFHGWWQIVSTSPEPGPLADPLYNTEWAAWKYINEGPSYAWPNCP